MNVIFPSGNLGMNHYRTQLPFRDVVQFVQSRATGQYYVMPVEPKVNQALVAVPIKVIPPVTNPAAREFQTVDGDTLVHVANQKI